MTPQEKAKGLVEKFTKVQACREREWDILVSCDMEDEDAKQCALIAVEEILRMVELGNTTHCGFVEYFKDAHIFYVEVKQEIEKL